MFNKTFLVALMLCACFFAATLARPQLQGLPGGQILGNTAGAGTAALGTLGQTVGGTAGSLAGGLAGGGLGSSLGNPLGKGLGV
ncbi:merozoite surface protein 2 [Drosophila montana]|uniref:merozoite surface protein 2 n=1 Tax=Drosophila montana TaxID=40370 RepID=UPI00313EF281